MTEAFILAIVFILFMAYLAYLLLRGGGIPENTG
jgi:hypothetical protein